jgi:hypothetical protein
MYMIKHDYSMKVWTKSPAQIAAAGVLPPIDSTVPFELGPMRQALRRAAAHQNHGRIVIQMEKAA